MRTPITAAGVCVAFLAVTTTVLLTATLVLGVTGGAAATTWTGTTGVVLLAVWLVVLAAIRRARRHGVRPRRLTHPVQAPPVEPLPETATP